MDFYQDYAQSPLFALSPLTPREHVRKRPGMYIGGTDQRALHHLIYIALDHLLEEAQIGRCTGIQVTLRPNHEVVISSTGLGVSVGQYKDTPFTTLEVLLQAVRISKRDLEPGAYGEGGHTLGIGLAVLNHLCEQLVVENRWDDALWRQSYAYGKPISALIRQAVTLPDPPGFQLTFRPDYTIFEAEGICAGSGEKTRSGNRFSDAGAAHHRSGRARQSGS